MKNKKIFCLGFLLILFISSYLFRVDIVQAISETPVADYPTSEGTIHNPLLKSSLQNSSENSPIVINTIITTFLSLLFIGASITFLFILLINGFYWMTAGGDQEKLKETKGKMTSAFIGLGIILCVFAIMKLINSLFGVNLLEFSIPRL